MIGQPYTPNPSSFTDLEFKIVEVIYRKGLDAYTILRASAPEGWKDGEQVSSHLPAVLFLTVFLHDFRDISMAGYQTTIGTAEFHELVVNKVDFKRLLTVSGKRGWPSIVSSVQV